MPEPLIDAGNGRTNERSVDPYRFASTMALSRFRTACTRHKGPRQTQSVSPQCPGGGEERNVKCVARNQCACEWYQGFYAKPSICCRVIFPLINYSPVRIPICYFAADAEREPEECSSGAGCDFVLSPSVRSPLHPLPKEVFVTLVTNYNKKNA